MCCHDSRRCAYIREGLTSLPLTWRGPMRPYLKVSGWLVLLGAGGLAVADEPGLPQGIPPTLMLARVSTGDKKAVILHLRTPNTVQVAVQETVRVRVPVQTTLNGRKVLVTEEREEL